MSNTVFSLLVLSIIMYIVYYLVFTLYYIIPIISQAVTYLLTNTLTLFEVYRCDIFPKPKGFKNSYKVPQQLFIVQYFWKKQ